MWKKEYSLLLSKICTVVAIAALAGILAGAPWLFSFMREKLAFNQYAACMTVGYAVGFILCFALVRLYALLRNIGKEKVFTAANTAHIRAVSWCCWAAALILLVGSFSCHLVVLVLSLAAAFAGLVLRVMKNVFAEAVAIKEEHDYTI